MRNDVLNCGDVSKIYQSAIKSKRDAIVDKELPAILSACKKAAEKLDRDILAHIDCGNSTIRNAVFEKLASELKDLGFVYSNDMNDRDSDHEGHLIVSISGWK